MNILRSPHSLYPGTLPPLLLLLLPLLLLLLLLLPLPLRLELLASS